MERIKRLNLYQKGVLLALVLLVLAFSVIYPVTMARKGYAYMDAILVPAEENGSTVYTGELAGSPARFSVSDNKTVLFEYRGKAYGPYTVREDPSAAAAITGYRGSVTGVEIRQGETLLFRGGYVPQEGFLLLFNEDGTLNGADVATVTATDGNGRIIGSVEPSVSTLIELTNGPELTHEGNWVMWLIGVLVCVFGILSILYADELFRCLMRFRIRNANLAEPSSLEIAGRYVSWTLLPILAMWVFCTGLAMIV